MRYILQQTISKINCFLKLFKARVSNFYSVTLDSSEDEVVISEDVEVVSEETAG